LACGDSWLAVLPARWSIFIQTRRVSFCALGALLFASDIVRGDGIMVDRAACHTGPGLVLAVMFCAVGGCHSDTSSRQLSPVSAVDLHPDAHAGNAPERGFAAERLIQQTLAVAEAPVLTPRSQIQFVEEMSEISEPEDTLPQPVSGADHLESLVQEALANHPELRRLRAATGEAWARATQAKSLPDPMARGTVFGEPMMMADGETRGTFMISQTIPSLKRLDARSQQASIEALMNQQAAQAAVQRITADVREAWYRLYLLEQLLQINEANEQLLHSLVIIASAQVEVGRATSGDVILASLELSRIEEERLQLRQQTASRTAILNQLLSRPADMPIRVANQTADADTDPPLATEISLDALRAIALEQQPEISMARLRTEATAMGIRIAKLERVPDLTLSYEHMFMSMHPGMHGSDPWQLGAGINVPLWNQKYNAIRQEAAHKHFAAHAGVEEVIRANDAMLLDLLEQARAAERTAILYQQTILPQIRQGLDADQRAYGQGAVQFERVIGNARNLLTAEAAYHRAKTDKAISLARLEQAAGSRWDMVERSHAGSFPAGSRPLTRKSDLR
jgi:outer membrane protein, heavy metal efflux system